MTKHYSQGFTYLTLLFMVAMLGATLALTGTLWSKTLQQERERELLFIGHQFRRAIMLYYERSPGLVKQYPKKLADLLEDSRYPTNQRYLREIYRDPLTGTTEWGLIIAPEGGIMGVNSLSDKAPQKVANFSNQYSSFSSAQKYTEWKFIYRPNLMLH